MAKIYETPNDIERERLKEVAKEARRSQSSARVWMGTGVVIAILGAIRIGIKPPMSKIEGFWKRTGEYLTDPVSIGGFITGSSMWSMFSAGKNAKQAEAQLEKLGPEKIVMPDNLVEQILNPNDSKHVNRLKNSIAVGEKSL